MKVSALGEFGLIDLLAKMIAEAGVDKFNSDLIIGIGDDTAAWKCNDSIQLATVDTMVQDVHFTLDTTTWEELGWKSLAINLSDIAAMGGVPDYALIALALPEDTDADNITGLYRGIIELAKATKTAIVGGNISGAPQVSITITVIGHGTKSGILRRSSAKPRDIIAITGHPGSAAAGLEMLSKKLKLKPEAADYLRKAFLHPTPRLTEGQVLVKNGIKAAIDTSDGLLSDLRHICEASKVSARIDIAKLPIHQAVRDSFREKAVEMALGGGEDYELLFTGNADAVERIRKELKRPVTVIGEITAGDAGEIKVVDAQGNQIKTEKTGWAHF